ncbi:hypothetical protein QBC34DRAFT_164264 [Podospora aff. communis PSN243]|uniref:BTB domain-containing protein n=1 Tax=Podospora aff. communis PSN243 TaxID=3040156 RepID=A0AAV9GBH7_9PEZI|nr:hypothetical protein QBC34DRAFT_164264 [Podospora aff. communis PSN243]
MRAVGLQADRKSVQLDSISPAGHMLLQIVLSPAILLAFVCFFHPSADRPRTPFQGPFQDTRISMAKKKKRACITQSPSERMSFGSRGLSDETAPVEGKCRVISYEHITSSSLFHFSIGPQRRKFAIPSILITIQSPAFERLVNSNFKEAQESHAELDNVDEDTFVRFVRYVYTGGYGTEAPEVTPPATSGSLFGSPFDNSRIERSNPFGSAGFGASRYDEPGSECSQFQRMVSSLQVSERPYRIAPSPESAHLENAVLSHAKVFVFADYWGVTRLKELSLRRLGKCLEEMELTEDKAEADEMAGLMEFCFDDKDPRPEELTSLILLYSACNIRNLWKSDRFQEFVSVTTGTYTEIGWDAGLGLGQESRVCSGSQTKGYG